MKFYIDKEELDNLDQDKLQTAIAALKSGKYRQHKGAMTDAEDPMSACCLMVIAQEVDGINHSDAIFNTPPNMQCSTWLPSCIKHLAVSFADACQNLNVLGDNKNPWLRLNHMNDGYLTHPQIAELLEGKKVVI